MTGNNHNRRPFQISLRSLMIGTVALGLFSAYVGTYYRLRTRGLAEAKEWGVVGFYYVPLDKALHRHDLSSHYRLRTLFAPANFVDRNVFGGPSPGAGFMRGLN
jgi:hypothetical protein